MTRLASSRLPNGWRWGSLSDLCEQDREIAKPGSDTDLPYLGLEHVEASSGEILQNQKDGEIVGNTFLFGPEHVLYGKLRPYLNKVAIPDFRGRCSTELIPLKPRGETPREFLAYALRRPELVQAVTEKNTGARMPRADMQYLLSLQVAIPPAKEQHRIVDILKRADGIRRMRKQAIQIARELIPALFVDMFGEQELPVSPLGSVAEVVSGVTKGRRFKGKKTVVVPYLRVANVQAGHLDLSEIKMVEVLPTDVEKLALQKGDVLLTEGGDYDKLGRGALWEHEIVNCIHQNHIFRVRADRSRLDPVYFANFLQTQAARLYFLKSAKRTTNLASINMTQLRNLPVPIPLLSDQAEFVARANDVKSIERQQETAELREDHLFESVLHRAFRGEL